MTTYILGAQLKELWYCESEALLWGTWYEQVQENGIKPLKELARKLSPYLHGIIESASYPLNTCTLEGINKKLIKRMGYGCRDTDYLFLKIKAAFPESRDEPLFMPKYSRDLKCVIAKQCSISSRQVRYWVQVFAIHGAGSFLPTKHAATAQTKRKALNLMWTND